MDSTRKNLKTNVWKKNCTTKQRGDVKLGSRIFRQRANFLKLLKAPLKN